MKQREVWKRDYPQEAKEKIKKGICPACDKPNKRNAICCSRKCSIQFFQKDFAVKDWKEIRLQAIKRDKNTCQWCGKKEVNTSDLIGDHILPIAVGGKEFDLDNIQTLCGDCNKLKTKRDAQIIAKHRRREKELKYDIEINKINFPQQKELDI